jgi:hypothetical protein
MKTSKERKETPVFSGVLQYFPDAINAVARQSWAGNEKHNPGEPLHWAREKSSDHMDCAIRHMMTPNEVDPETGGTHLVAAAWRILAALQLQCEAIAEYELDMFTGEGVPIEEAFILTREPRVAETFTMTERKDYERKIGDRIYKAVSDQWGIIQEIEETCDNDSGSLHFLITARPVETTP